MNEPNPAAPVNKDTKIEAPREGARKRIPMSTPQRRLEVPDLPGFHFHWFLESRVIRAQQAGYDFVEDREVHPNQRAPANKGETTGNTNLGSSRVTVFAGPDSSGKPESHVLMKLPEELWLQDKAAIDARNAGIMSGIFRDEQILGTEKDDPQDRGVRYVGRSSERKALLNRPTRKYRV